MKRIRLLIFFAAALAANGCERNDGASASIESQNRPNFIIILADDLGYTDLGAYGGEIPTPNIDRLAATGVRFTNFYAAPGCSPSRAMLMSGAPPHVAGLGGVPELLTEAQRRQPGYEGYLNFRVAALSEILQDGGYDTFMAGKWHLGKTAETSPSARGFDRAFALLGGGASHFSDQRGISPQTPVARYREDGVLVSLPENFYSTDAYTDKIIDYIEGAADNDKPFFAYLAYSAPHWPMQAPDDWLEKFRGRYDRGYQAIYDERVRRGIELGVLPPGSDRVSKELDMGWKSYNAAQKSNMARRMDAYAAMVAKMDEQVGRLLKFLEETGEADNTIIFFLSDNGPDFTFPEALPHRASWVESEFDNSTENLGREGSFMSYGMGWAQVGAGPFHLFKGTVGDGGIRAPAIVAGRGVSREGAVETNFTTMMDIAPTILDLAGLAHPSDNSASGLEPLHGASMQNLLNGERRIFHNDDYSVIWEMLGTRAIRQQNWKLVYLPPPLGDNNWALYDMSIDPFEKTDIASAHPDIVDMLLKQFEAYDERHQLVEYPAQLLETMLAARPDDPAEIE